MKMVIAIVNRDDSSEICTALTQAGYRYTRISTTGGFLRSGNTTLLIGTEDGELNALLRLMKEHCATRDVTMPANVTGEEETDLYGMPVTRHVTVGGATVFVTDVDQFIKL